MAEGARLESVCRGNSTEGSNPSLSAREFSTMAGRHEASLPSISSKLSKNRRVDAVRGVGWAIEPPRS